jgi:hypothetical protein
MPSWRPRGVLVVVVLLGALGVFLRVWRAGDLLIWMDEIWAVEQACERSFAWIFTHFGQNDACIPLALYAKAVLFTLGLSEWSLRMPSVLAGCLTVCLVGRVSLSALRPAHALLATGAVATSPYLVYLSREARPHAITVCLFSLAWLLVVAWTRGRPRMTLLLGALCAGLCVWFHPVTALSVVVLALYPLGCLCVGRVPRARAGDLLFAGVVLLGLCLLLVVPALPSFLEVARTLHLGKEGPGRAGVTTVRHGLALLLGVPHPLPLLLWGGVGALGLAVLWRRYAAEVCLVLALFLAQGAALLWLQTYYLEVPFVWLRYHAHLLPLFLVVLTAAVAAPMEQGARKIPRVAPCLAAVAVLGLTAYHALAGHYSVSSRTNYNANPILVFLPPGAEPMPPRLAEATPRFYREVLPTLPPGGLVEAPVSLAMPLYGVYQRWHGRTIAAGALGEGKRQGLFFRPGVGMRTVVAVDDWSSLVASGARYLVVHKSLPQEIQAVYEALRRDAGPATQLVATPAFQVAELARHFGAGPPFLPFSALPLYEDSLVAVYDLSSP